MPGGVQTVRVFYARAVKRWLLRVAIVVVCAPFMFCVWRRSVVTEPALTARVVDAAGAPVPGAEVVVYWWSYPHHQLRGRFAQVADADGRVAFAGASRGETILPLCMHGVPQHEHTVCVTVPGKGQAGLALERSGQSVTLTLGPAPYTDCDRFRTETPQP